MTIKVKLIAQNKTADNIKSSVSFWSNLEKEMKKDHSDIVVIIEVIEA